MRVFIKRHKVTPSRRDTTARRLLLDEQINHGFHEEEFRSSTQNQPFTIPNFPEDLIAEILLRLPAKSLVKFKCVSKPWRSLISSPEFIKTHLAIASGRDDYGHHRLIFTVLSKSRKLRNQLYSVSSLLHKSISAAKVVNIDNPLQHPESVTVVGSCNGLVCFYNRIGELVLRNPCTREYKKLPDTGIGGGNEAGSSWIFGFGYDNLNDDYKLVGIYWGLYSDPDCKIILYSLKNNSWRKMDDLKVAGPSFGKRFYLCKWKALLACP
ncbi:OLC1v1003122C1 [Oldenlandia corymbosa var. corymbosa]|uniref:OLC1v1003122C1 n=1 Tax=Oldenlandia corymbosa var. corymbosa TaxID=529605 RepID=A0AAV1DA01_OLDCO|nr:OLC1v1003122C1 [Oldenlandia corymbosa var. corymbosa]